MRTIHQQEEGAVGKRAAAKLTRLQQEVDSLKTVVEMRTTEVHELRAERLRLQEKLELFDQQQLSLRKANAQVGIYYSYNKFLFLSAAVILYFQT